MPRIVVATVFRCVASRNKRGEWPAPGNRYSHMGTLYYNGNYGYSYSCSANETNGMFLDFNTQELNSSGGYDRAHGLQLRCLSE